MLIGFELYPRWVPLVHIIISYQAYCLEKFLFPQYFHLLFRDQNIRFLHRIVWQKTLQKLVHSGHAYRYNDGRVISWVHPTTSVWKLLQTNRKQIESVTFWTRRVLNKDLYGEVQPWPGLNPHRFIYHFSQKRYPFRIPFTSLTDS